MLRQLPKQIDFLTSWGSAVTTAIKRYRWRGLAVGGLLIALATAIVQQVFETQLSAALGWAWRAIRWGAGLPVGYVGLICISAVLALFLFIMIWANIQILSRKDAKQSTPPPLTPADLAAIADLRFVWNQSGGYSIEQMFSLFSDVVYYLRDQRYWGELLQPKRDNLEHARSRFNTVIGIHSTASVSDVRQAFNGLYSAYLDAIRWVARILANNDADARISRFDTKLEQWKNAHALFFSSLYRLHQDPGHHKAFHIFVQVTNGFDDEFYRLIRDAEDERRSVLKTSPANETDETSVESQTAGSKHL
jgi:hypothetical protein